MPPTLRPPVRARAARAASAAARARATAFGLDICAARLPPLLELSRAAPTGRELQLNAADPGDLRRALERDPQRRELCVRAGPDGRDCFRIDEHARSYVLWGQDRGSYMIAARGDRLRLSPWGDAHTWQRFLVGQVLPFAALLRGLEIFHASAVSLDGGVIAFTGGSSAGKTSVALALCRLGARFVADDVLALEVGPRSLVAHPGCPLAGLDRREAARLRLHDRIDFRRALGGDQRELVLAVEGIREPQPLGALFLLERRASGVGPPRFEAVEDPRALLACTFNFALDTSARMLGLLEACALVARRRVERVVVGPATDADELASAVLERVAGGR